MQALGAVAYELLGGSISPLQVSGVSFDTMAAHYTPLSTLSEEGNEVLKRALDPAESFASAQGFFEALKNLEVLGIRPSQPKPPVSSAIRAATAAELSHRSRAATTHTTTHTTKTAPKKKKLPVKFLSGLVTVAAIGAGVYFLAPRNEPKPETEPPREAPDNRPDEPAATPAKDDAPVAVQPAAAPETKPVAPPEPPVENDREQKLRAALAAAGAAEERGDPAEAIAAWLRAARDFPESDAPRKRLDFVIDPLRKRSEIQKPAVFDTLKPLLVEAAQLDSVSAMLLLAEAERPRNVRESFAWYSAAAVKGRPEAYLPMGLILSNGINGEKPELEKAAYYFTLAAESNDVDAKMALAECYLFGKGVSVDFDRGVRWLKEAADQNNLRAMNRLADGYDHGRFNLPVNYDEAFRLWSKVIEIKNPIGDSRQPVGEAFGNLGVLYMNGHGTTLDENRAVKLFADGARLNDPNSMYLLGACTLDGRGGLAPNATEGQRLIKRAADAGSKAAQGWCRTHGIIFTQK